MIHYRTLRSSEPEFPDELTHIDPIVSPLYTRGDLSLEKRRIAIVGSRRFTAYGKMATEEIAQHLAQVDITVVSGLALGIDSIAHKACVDEGGHTIAVLPCGIDKVYPASHRELGKQILDTNGAIVSEYKPGTPPMKHRYPERNRIISGLSEAIVVVEAAHKSGSLITARLAMEQGKEVFAVPGPINSSMSKGTNSLIQSGAHVVTQPTDITALLGISSKKKQKKLTFSNEVEEKVYTYICKNSPADADNIPNILDISSAECAQAVSMLEIRGYIFAKGGNNWGAKQ